MSSSSCPEDSGSQLQRGPRTAKDPARTLSELRARNSRLSDRLRDLNARIQALAEKVAATEPATIRTRSESESESR